MGRNNADFNEGSFTLSYNNETLFHGTRQKLSVGDPINLQPAERGKGINVPVSWTTTSPIDAAHYGARDEGDSKINVYTTEPVDRASVRGAYSGILHPGERKINTHFISKHGFTVTGVHNG
jgi:hypothetical protein